MTYFKQYRVTLIGNTPLLLHNSNFDFEAKIKKLRDDPANKGRFTKGDDRTPAQTWMGALYMDPMTSKNLILPSDNLMTMLREGGAQVPTGRGNKTFKTQSQTGIATENMGWDLLVGGKPVPIKTIMALESEENYEVHKATVEKLGFALFEKGVRMGSGSRHIRVRPRFDQWAACGMVRVTDEMITEEVLRTIISFAGAKCGIGDWRPSSSTPGQFGTFTVTLEEVR